MYVKLNYTPKTPNALGTLKNDAILRKKENFDCKCTFPAGTVVTHHRNEGDGYEDEQHSMYLINGSWYEDAGDNDPVPYDEYDED
jgi:hypothetical protein